MNIHVPTTCLRKKILQMKLKSPRTPLVDHIPFLLPPPPHYHHCQGISIVQKSVFNPMHLFLQYAFYWPSPHFCSPISHPILLTCHLKPA